ncbi:MAG: AraC family transcriptional regulator [bacterium]|nr:AraC family transcriptional regulator [bacterium]
MQILKKDIFIEMKKRDYEWNMSPFHCHNLYEIYYLASGKRTMMVEQKIYDLYPGDVLLLLPDVLHKGAGTDPHEKFGMEFSKHFLECFFTDYLQQEILKCFKYAILHLDTEIREQFEALYKKMYSEYKNGELYAVSIADILLLLNRAGKRNPPQECRFRQYAPNASERVNAVISYIEGNFANIKSIEEIAEHTYLNKSYMCRLFKKETNMTVMNYLYNFRIQQSCEMLRSVDSSVECIARSCGFENTSHFIKMFKSMLGCTPGQFRKNKNGI